MMRSRMGVAALVVTAAAFAHLAAASAPPMGVAATSGAAASTRAASASTRRSAEILQLERYYANLYGQPLAEKNRLSQLIGIVSLSRIDAPAVTNKLLEALGQGDLLVGQLAWESLHARQGSLSPEQRATWLAGGMEIARKGGFPGATVAPLLAAAAEQPASAYRSPAELLVRIVEENDPSDEGAKHALDAARDAVVAWNDVKIVQILISRMDKREALAPQLARILQGLAGAPAPSDDPAVLRAAWSRFARQFKPGATTLPAYRGVGAVFPPPQRIDNPSDPRWRKELELAKLRVESVEIAFLIDATGSMAASNDYVTAYVETITRLLKLMSSDVRAATIYYRHEVDPALMLKCCREISTRKDDFRVRVLPLTADPAALVQRMRAQKLSGRFSGHGGDGAYAGGISTAMTALKWNAKGKRIIACTGDAQVTPGSEKGMLDVAQKAKDEGYLLMFVVRDATAARDVASASKLATGLDPILYKPDIERLQTVAADKASAAAIDQFRGTAFETMTLRVLELSLAPDYRDRVAPLVSAALPILAAQDAAARAAAAVRN